MAFAHRLVSSLHTSGRAARVSCFAAILALAAGSASAADIGEVRTLYKTGRYAEAIEACKKAIPTEESTEAWWMLQVRAELITGRYKDALKSAEAGLEKHSASLPLWLLMLECYRFNDRLDEAEAVLPTILAMVDAEPRRFLDAPSQVALGKFLLIGGADAKRVLDIYYDRAKRNDPESPDVYMASGELALTKFDFAYATENFEEAVRRLADDPDVYFGLSRSNDDDPDVAAAALAKALELNPNHIPSLLFQADNLISREDYTRAEEIIKKVLEVNPKQPRAWAFRAVMANLAADKRGETAARKEALSTWSKNPEVDYEIGRKLAQDYRFAEAVEYQRRAIAFAPDYTQAKSELCQDLLRLAKDEEGWALAATVLKEDPYNVMAYNLMTLHDVLAKFKVLESEHFTVRMEAREAQIYGDRVMVLLEKARETLGKKYGMQLAEKTTIEIFPQQKDFAIRTFGLPGGDGFLGVCFGPLVTVNSPASRGATPANWEAIVWHEFCHTITLTKTKNKMPRWLSEGISTYEERQANPSWGEKLIPPYRDMILEDMATPVSKLSSAFLRPPSALHLQFAYYESSMVVEYIVKTFGDEALRRILTDLGDGEPINTAIAKHTEPIDRLDTHFEAWLKERANQMAPGAAWERPELAVDATSATLAAWNKDHPNNYWGLVGEGQMLLSEQNWIEAKAPLEKAISLYPQFGEDDSPYTMLAVAHRQLGDKLKEREVLEKQMTLNADAVDLRVRLMELASEAKDWKAVKKQAEDALAVNPLVPAPHRFLAKSAEEMGERKLAIQARRVLLLIDPFDRAEHYYRIGFMLEQEKDLAEARRAVLQALEEAPRYRAAHVLLQEIVSKMPAPTPVLPVGPGGEPTTAPAEVPGNLPTPVIGPAGGAGR